MLNSPSQVLGEVNVGVFKNLEGGGTATPLQPAVSAAANFG